jgi:tripartite-type tricarboxylate transporter receptor subunit TctC
VFPKVFHMVVRRVWSLTLAGVLLAATAGAGAQAQDYPNRTIRMVTPFAPGATTDLLSRIMCQKMTQQWGQPCVVENRSGATGMIGAYYTAKQPPDGYTLVNVISTHVIHPVFNKSTPFDPVKDFTPVILLAKVTNLLIVHPSVPVRTPKEFIAFAKARKGDLVLGTSGTGSSNHVSAELLKHATGIQMSHIPYKGGAPAVADLIGGQIPVMMASFLTGSPHVLNGRARGIAVSSKERQKVLPDVPTLLESGINVEADEWWALLGPAGMNRDVVAKINAEVRRIFALPDVRERIATVGVTYLGSTPEELGAFLRKEMEQNSKVLRDAGIKAE